MSRAFEAYDLSAEQHCIIIPRQNEHRFLGAMQAADVVLDSIGWSGCNSLIDAICVGLPIVTVSGRLMRSRHGAALLNATAIGGSIGKILEHYVAIAVNLGHHPEHRSHTARSQRDGLEKLSNAHHPVDVLAAYIERWVTRPPSP